MKPELSDDSASVEIRRGDRDRDIVLSRDRRADRNDVTGDPSSGEPGDSASVVMICLSAAPSSACGVAAICFTATSSVDSGTEDCMPELLLRGKHVELRRVARFARDTLLLCVVVRGIFCRVRREGDSASGERLPRDWLFPNPGCRIPDIPNPVAPAEEENPDGETMLTGDMIPDGITGCGGDTME